MSNHTPGPWEVMIDDAGFIDFYRIDANGETVGEALLGEADARLIAAAPDLLAALQALVVLDDGNRSELWCWSEEFEAARAAIAKATGEQP